MGLNKNHSIALFFAFAVLLGFLVWLRNGSINLPEGNDAIWFNAGLFALFLGSFITEYRFTKPNDVFVNCLTAFASISTLSNPPLHGWWELLKWGAIACGFLAIVLAWDPGQEAKLRTSIFRSVIYKIVTTLGSAKVIFSLVFILSLLTYFDLNEMRTKVFVLVWAAFLMSALLDLPELARFVFRSRGRSPQDVVGVTHSFLAPSIVYCRALGSRKIPIHKFVGFSQSVNEPFHTFGVVIGARTSASENRSVIALLDSSIDENNFNDRTLITLIGDGDRKQLEDAIDAAEIESAAKIVGTVSKGTNISQLRLEIFGKPAIAAGSLLRVKTWQARPTYYQVFDGIIEEEQTIRDSSRAFVEARAEQVGCWDDARGGFETHDWVAPERSCVHLVDEGEDPPPYELNATEATVGEIPNSNFPVNIDLNDLVLYHSAILGVTGSGKSFLTFSLVEDCAAKGIKVICVDPTGDYQKYLAGAVMLSQSGALEAFLASERMIGIIETGRISLHPIKQAQIAANVCLKWCKENRTQEEVLSPKPKVLVIFEEAHILVPEWNFNPERNLQDIVSSTSQTVLQARKFGLGFLIVSQRTANVVKSILNQCNTIFSFQAFDETGFEFLKNYMGSFHVRALPNLKVRHGILVGKASKSQRPIMVHFEEQARVLQDAPAPEMPIPQVGANPAEN